MIVIEPDIPELTVVSHLGNYCNFNCSYCSQSSYRKEHPLSKEQEHKKILSLYENLPCKYELKYLVNKALKVRKDIILNLNLYGGEASEYKTDDLIKIIKGLNMKFDRITLTTNFSKPLKYYLNLRDSINELNSEFRISASYHEEYTSVNLFSDKFNKLLNEGIYSLCQFTLTNNNYNLLSDLIERIPCNNINPEICFDSKNGENFTIPLSKDAEEVYLKAIEKSDPFNEKYNIYLDNKYIGAIKSAYLRYSVIPHSLSILGGYCLLKNIEIQENGAIDKRCCLSMNNMSKRNKENMRYCICQRLDCRNVNFLYFLMDDNKITDLEKLLV